MAESRMGRTIFSSSFFQSSSESLSSRPRASLDLSTFSYAPFRTDPALLSFDPASVALSSESQGRISRNSQAVRRHQTQRESFDFRNNASSSPPTRDMEEPLDTSRTYEVTPTDTTPPRPPPPVFISCGPSPKRRPPKVAELLSPPTRDAPRLQPTKQIIVRTIRAAKSTSACPPQRPKILTSREATIPSPEEALFKASLPRRLVPSVKVTRKIPSPPLRRNKSEITPSTWRQELKLVRKNSKEKQKKDADDYSDDFESENEAENDKENNVKPEKKAVKRRSPARYTYKPKSPPAVTMPEPKKRHYDAVQVQKYINRQRQQRLDQRSKAESDKKLQQEETKKQLCKLQNRTKQILTANVRHGRLLQAQATVQKRSVSPVALHDLRLNLSNLRSPSASGRSSLRGSNNRLSDEFIEHFVSQHQPRPTHQLVLSQADEELDLQREAEKAATTVQSAFWGFDEGPVKEVEKTDAGTQMQAPPFEFFDNCLRQTTSDPYSFIETVKRKLLQANRAPEKTETEVLPSQADKYESDFESSAVSASPSEEINVGESVHSGAESHHSLVSITPDKNEEITKIALKPSSVTSSVSTNSSPLQLVAPDVGLVVPVNGQRPNSGPEGQSASSSGSATSSTLPSAEIRTQTDSQEDEKQPVSFTVYRSGSKTIKVPHLKKPTDSLFDPPVKEIRQCFEGKSIEELEASIIAGFARLGEEMNATRALFNIPLPRMEPPRAVMPTQPTLQDVLPRLSMTLADICKVVPILQEQAQSLLAKSPSLGDATEADVIDEMQDETDVSSATITEDQKESTEIVSEHTTSGGLPVSEQTTSGGLPRVVEAMKDFEMSLQSAQGSLMHLTEQESLEEVSEQVSEEYSSKFDRGSEAAEEVPSESDTPTASDVLTEINGKDFATKSSKSKSSSSTRDSLKHSTGGEQDSFTVFSFAMFQQLFRDQELRAKQQRALLKQREDAIYEKSKAELIFLENQKKEMRTKGTENLIPGIKKRQRAILLRLNQERDEIKRLRESHKIASQERKLMLQQQHHIAKMKLAAKEIANKLYSKDLSPKSQRLLDPSRRNLLELSEDESSAASISLDTSDLSQSKASSCAEELDKGNSLREALISLKRGEKLKRPAEKKELGREKVAKKDQQPMESNDQSASLPPTAESTQKSSAPESVVTSQDTQLDTQTISENLEAINGQSPSVEEISNLDRVISKAESIIESIRAQEGLSMISVDKNRESSSKEESAKTPVTIKVPLSPRLQNRGKRRHSSGSDESIILSQNETASEQSDVESRICALQEQLRRRKMEAEKLRKEQKRCHRERLRAKEQSLMKQIQAYDTYIQETRRDLEQEFDNGNSVRPQIKQPRVAEKVRPLKTESVESPVSEVKSSEQLKSIETDVKDTPTQLESSEIKEELSAVLPTESKVESVHSEIAVSSPIVEISIVESEEEIQSASAQPVDESQVEDESKFEEEIEEEEEIVSQDSIEEQSVEIKERTPSPVLTLENIPDIPDDKNTTQFKLDAEEGLIEIEEIEEEITEETFHVLAEVTLNGQLDKDEADSSLSQSSDETTIESPRRVEEEIVSEEQILRSVESIKKVVDEEEVDKITHCLMTRLLEDTLRSAKAAREVERHKSLKEELEEAKEPERVKSISPPTSSILDRVHSLLAENGGHSPRDKIRPQDFMGLTYVEDSLSPEPGFEVPGVCDEVLSAASPIVVSSPPSQQKVDLQEGPKEDKTEDTKKESKDDSGQQEWFDEDFGLSSSRKEAEELRLQQLQIEQEIQQLQSQQLNFYYGREIPNKPPPPYTPPSETSLSQEEDKSAASVPNTKEEVLPFMLAVTEKFYHARMAGRELDSVQPPISDDQDEIEHVTVYKKFLFDLGRELVEEVYGLPEEAEPVPPWLEAPAAKRRQQLLRPKSLQQLQQRVQAQVSNLLGFSERNRREKLVIRWSRKRRDQVDELLVREAQEEEPAWTNYERDEAAVKSQLVDAIFAQQLARAAEEALAQFAQRYPDLRPETD